MMGLQYHRSDGVLVSEQLMAAAPDLLAALEEAKAGLEWYQDRFPAQVNDCDAEAMERIDAAIAKAKGETK